MILRLVKQAAALALICLGVGCVSAPQHRCADRPFDFQRDTFAYANELAWEYGYNEAGEWVGQKREQRPEYSLHCVPMSRSARQFFEHARFEADQPKVSQREYSKLARNVTRTKVGADKPDIVIPGYASLREFSEAEPALLKKACGGAWQSYLQRGNWRMLLPFSRKSQETTAAALVDELKRNCPPILHAVMFPSLSMNHTVLVIDWMEWHDGVIFICYDPNDPQHPIALNFDRKSRWFIFPQTPYFRGGPVNAYRIFTGWFY